MSETNDTRQEFEVLLVARGASNIRKGDGYGDSLSQSFWVFWQVATERAAAPQWQPIETAPMHQTVLVSVVGCGVTFGSRIGSCGWSWEELDDEPADAIVSHWMPLPPPPAIGQGGAA